MLDADTILTETISALKNQDTFFTSQLSENLLLRYEERKVTKVIQLMRYLNGQYTSEESSDLLLLQSLQRFGTTLSTRLFTIPQQKETNNNDCCDDDISIVEGESSNQSVNILSGPTFADRLKKRLTESHCTKIAPSLSSSLERASKNSNFL